MIKIEIDENKITFNGAVYKLVSTYEEEMCGRKEIAEMLGFYHADGTPNLNNLYSTNPNAKYYFPNFEIEKANKKQKPWTRKQVKAWLAIPLNERRKMYKESLDEIN